MRILGKNMSPTALSADTEQSDREWIAEQQKKAKQMGTQFLTSRDYPHLCDACKTTLDQIAQIFVDDLLGDTDDEEAPAMYMYDNALYCGGHVCKNNSRDEKMLIIIDEKTGKKYRVMRFDVIKQGDIFLMPDNETGLVEISQPAEVDVPEHLGAFIIEPID